MVWRFLKKLGIKSPYDPAIALLGIYPVKNKIEKDTCIPLFTAALFTIARTWKQPICPLTDKWIKNLWYKYIMEYSVQFSSVTQSCPTLCDPMDCSPPGSSPMRFSKQEYWSGLPFPSPGGLPDPRIEARSLALQADSVLTER